MLEKIDYNALGQAIDTTFGRSSTPKTSSYSIKMSLTSKETLLVSYIAIVSFRSEIQMIDSKRAHTEEANLAIAATIKRIKSIYKELTGNTIKLSENKETIQNSVEIINMNCHNANRMAYFRQKIVFTIS